MIRPSDDGWPDRSESTDEDGRIGIFRSWRALYVSVLLYTFALIVLLYILTEILNYSAV